MTTTTTPAELLLSDEAAHLSNLDLLTLLVGPVAQSLVNTYPTLSQMDDASPHELSAIDGLDEEGVVRLLAMRELTRRRAVEKVFKGTPVLSAAAAVEILEPFVRGETREVVMVLALDTKKRLITSPIVIVIGTNDSVHCHPREVFRPLIRVSASVCLIAHLHPSSGEPVPSPDDIMLTERLRSAGELVGIPVADHIVIGRGCYLSMAERGLL